MSKENTPNPVPVSGPLSDNERLKQESDYLKGTIKSDLNDDVSGGFRGDNFQLIRFHGMYEQDDRDLRSERLNRKLEPLKNVMLRCRLPGGIITPKQWLGIDNFASKHTEYGSIRLTNRQTFQFHGVLKENIKNMHQWLDKLGLDALATAGDVNRNVLCSSNPVESHIHQHTYEWAKKISEHLLPKTSAYAELWLDGEKLASNKEDEEPILGKTYLPRKFKTTVVTPPHNDVDVHANDLNFVAITEGQGENAQLIGFNVLVGGGLSITHGDKNTFPNTAYDFGFIPLSKTLDCAAAVVSTQRDWGNRSNRKNAKTRYTLQRVSVDTFKQEVELRMKHTFAASKAYEFTSRGDRIGWIKGVDDKYHLTLFIENGRLLGKKKQGLAEIAKQHTGDFRITANQNIVIAGIEHAQKDAIEALAIEYGLIDKQQSSLRQSAMACVSLPTCPLAMAEAERFLPTFITEIEALIAKHNVQQPAPIVRIAGCPNGCGRALLAEIGLIGKSIGRYNLYLGGNKAGTRIPRQYQENITLDEILSVLNTLIEQWANQGHENEHFGDFVVRENIVVPVINGAIDFWEKAH